MYKISNTLFTSSDRGGWCVHHRQINNKYKPSTMVVVVGTQRRLAYKNKSNIAHTQPKSEASILLLTIDAGLLAGSDDDPLVFSTCPPVPELEEPLPLDVLPDELLPVPLLLLVVVDLSIVDALPVVPWTSVVQSLYVLEVVEVLPLVTK